MPCHHKFRSYLDLETIDFEPTTLIVGTFVPEWPDGNTGDWFYGRTHDANGNRNNYFWDILPKIYGAQGLAGATPEEWKLFCRQKQIAVTDLIHSIDDADADNAEHNKVLAGYADDAIAYNFDDFVFVNIVKILRDHPSIKNIYLTRGITEAFWRHLWNPVMHYCSVNNIRERRLLTPSKNAVSQQEAHNNHNPESRIALLEDYLFMRWKQEWHF